jgi:uncharacterized protein with FMN-binding domain
MNKKKKVFQVIGLIIVGIYFLGCGEIPIIGGPINHDKLLDGIYKGSYKSGFVNALVKVTIKDKKVVNIEIVKHWTLRGEKAEPIIIKRIIEKQSTKVDAVSGATISSRVLMNAVQKAIENAYQKSDKT